MSIKGRQFCVQHNQNNFNNGWYIGHFKKPNIASQRYW